MARADEPPPEEGDVAYLKSVGEVFGPVPMRAGTAWTRSTHMPTAESPPAPVAGIGEARSSGGGEMHAYADWRVAFPYNPVGESHLKSLSLIESG